MELYGKRGSSLPQKLLVFALALLFLALSYGLLFPADTSLNAAEAGQRVLLLSFNLVTFLRIGLTAGFLLKRSLPWEEAFAVPLAFGVYFLGFAYFATWQSAPNILTICLGLLLFMGGSSLNTISELQRHAFKVRSENKGKLYTGGLFRDAVHINYFGDVLWVLGYAVMTSVLLAYLIPVLLFVFFAFYNAPKLDAYLRGKYAPEFGDYQQKTVSIVPFIY